MICKKNIPRNQHSLLFLFLMVAISACEMEKHNILRPLVKNDWYAQKTRTNTIINDVFFVDGRAGLLAMKANGE